ncbi:MAG: PD-(D/E)XK nuclease family protein [Hyphomicrobiales bacterium]|nr:PD-(D/E)XK nuclease family protein [Hyphomicrobiales bacterium]
MIASSFERHGIEHLSASSLNVWAAQPALWIMERLLGRRLPAGIAAARGKAVEHGVHLGLTNPRASINECIDAAEREFIRQTALSADPRREEERKKLAGWVTGALAELRQYGTPDGYQEKIEIRLDGIAVPIVGYIDWLFSQHGLIVDLKTTERFPSQIGNSHGRQGAVYASAHGNFGMRFAYAKPAPGKTDKRQVTVYEMSGDDVRQHLAALRTIAHSLGRFLAVSNDPHELAGLIVPDFDSFWWSEPAERAAGREVFGF